MQFTSKLTIPRLVLVLCLIQASVAAAEKLFFRYEDEQGRTVLNDQLPPEAASNGYEVIRLDGTVVKTVKGALTEQERLQQNKELSTERMRQEEAEQLREWDESLLLRYSDVADIKDAKKRALGEIQVRISILKGNLNYLKTQVEREEYRAAEAERQELEVTDAQKEAIRTLKWQIGDVEELIEIRQKELDDTAARYDRDMKRFETLIDRIGRR